MFKKSGWIFIDKPIGLSSNSLLQKVRLNLGRVKAGFVGTLDPLASGCLPIAVGHATKVINLAEKVENVMKNNLDLMNLNISKINLLKEYRQSLISSVVTGKIRITEDMIWVQSIQMKKDSKIL